MLSSIFEKLIQKIILAKIKNKEFNHQTRNKNHIRNSRLWNVWHASPSFWFSKKKKEKENEKKDRAVETANPSSMGKYFKKGGIMFGNVAIEDFSRHQGNSNDR